MPHRTLPIVAPSGRHSPKPASSMHLTHIADPPYRGEVPSTTGSGYRTSSNDATIIIDNGSSCVRAGWSSDPHPRLAFPPQMARYTDRKLNRKLTFIGSEVYFDGTARGQSKSVYEPGSNVVNNWDVQEGLLDYIFVKLGVQADRIDRPVVMTEPLACLPYTRKVMSEMLFELYGVPKVAYGIDSLFGYAYNGGTTGLVVSSAHSSTHLIPVVDRKPLIAHATRLDWGRSQCAEYLQRLLRAKYPGVLTAGKVNETQVEDLVRQHCYISRDFCGEMKQMLEWSGLEDRDRVVQLPFQEKKEGVQKTDEEVARAEEKRREGGRRLQEQAAKMRLEKLVRKEQELEYYKQLQIQISTAPTKKEARSLLEEDEFRDEVGLDRKIKEMEKSIRKQRSKDVGDVQDEGDAEDAPPSYPLLDTPDHALDDDGLKAKRAQRLLKSSHDARTRAKAEKEASRARRAEEQRLDDLRREADPEVWVAERRAARQTTLQRLRERERLRADLGNRKSQAAQMRMKHIANLASDNPLGRKRRRGGDKDDDGFGADDADWAIYREIGGDGDGDEDSEEEDLGAQLQAVEAQLLMYDDAFTQERTLERERDWTQSIVHSFTRGPWAYDAESAKEQAQLHLNVERIRVPEVLFQPSIAGVDQAGVAEMAEDLVMQRLSYTGRAGDVLKDVFATGGYTLFAGFEERLAQELRAVLPSAMMVGVRTARDPVGDAWSGAAGWSREELGSGQGTFVSREEWAEKGGEYLREHAMGNVFT